MNGLPHLDAFMTLWSQARSQPDYVEAGWAELEAELRSDVGTPRVREQIDHLRQKAQESPAYDRDAWEALCEWTRASEAKWSSALLERAARRCNEMSSSDDTRWSHAWHGLWSRAKDEPNYVKREWIDVDGDLRSVVGAPNLLDKLTNLRNKAQQWSRYESDAWELVFERARAVQPQPEWLSELVKNVSPQ